MQHRDVEIPAAAGTLPGDLSVPTRASGLVVFAHGSGSSRFSTRNRYVAGVFQQAGLGTLLFDLLTPDEERIDRQTAELRFDIALLGERLLAAIDFLTQDPEAGELALGLFGASTGAAAALRAAAARPARVHAVVSRGGRPDLAGDDALAAVEAPTLLIVGGDDTPVIAMNRNAAARLRAPQRIEIVAGATHLFPEPGKLEAVAELSRDWFLEHLAPPNVRAES